MRHCSHLIFCKKIKSKNSTKYNQNWRHDFNIFKKMQYSRASFISIQIADIENHKSDIFFGTL